MGHMNSSFQVIGADAEDKKFAVSVEEGENSINHAIQHHIPVCRLERKDQTSHNICKYEIMQPQRALARKVDSFDWFLVGRPILTPDPSRSDTEVVASNRVLDHEVAHPRPVPCQ